MKLYDKKLERRLLASVKTTREWKTRRRPGVLLRKFSLEKPYLYIPLGLIFLVAIESMQAEKGLEWILFGLALYCFAEAVRRGRRLNLHLTSSNERAFFFFYPMSAESFFRLALERSILGSLTVWCVAAVTYAVATRTEGPWIFRTIAYATLEWLLTVIVMLLIVRKIQWVPQWLQISLYVVLVLALNAPASLWHTITLATSILPTSWSNASFLYLQSGTVAWLAIAAEILVAAGLASWLLQIYRKTILGWENALAGVEPNILEALTADPESSGDEDLAGEEKPAPPVEEVEQAKGSSPGDWQRMRQNHFALQVTRHLESHNWRPFWDWNEAPWVERWVAKGLTVQERETVPYLIGLAIPNWSARWKTSVIAAAASAGLANVYLDRLFMTLAGIAFAISAVTGVPLGGGSWPILASGVVSGKFSPIAGCYPVNYGLVSRIIAKSAIARFLTWLPLGLIVGVILGWKISGQPMEGLWMVVKASLLWMALLPVVITLHFSKGTNDTSELKWRTVPMLAFLSIVGVGVLGACIVAISAPISWSAILIAAIFVLSLAIWWLYRCLYERGEIDLLRIRQ